MMNKTFGFLVSFVLSISLFSISSNSAQALMVQKQTIEVGYMWFDLGNVLIETRDGFDKIHWMPGVRTYLQELRSQGFRIGLITNIPEKWGEPGDRNSKIDRLQAVINQGWVDETPFDLEEFDEVLVPLYTHESKPASKLFLDALRIADGEGLKSYFQGETPREVEAARALGLTSFLVEYEDDGRTPIFLEL